MLGMIGRNAMNGFSRDEMIVLGKRLAYSHVPSVYDWRSMLRLPVTLDQAVETIPNTAPSLHLGYIRPERRSEEHTSELQSLMRISYAVFCLKKKKTIQTILTT